MSDSRWQSYSSQTPELTGHLEPERNEEWDGEKYKVESFKNNSNNRGKQKRTKEQWGSLTAAFVTTTTTTGSSNSHDHCCSNTAVTMATFKVQQGTLSVPQLVPLSPRRSIWSSSSVSPLQFVRPSLLTKTPACCDSRELTGVIRPLSPSLHSPQRAASWT